MGGLGVCVACGSQQRAMEREEGTDHVLMAAGGVLRCGRRIGSRHNTEAVNGLRRERTRAKK